jgi:hypothetical protein
LKNWPTLALIVVAGVLSIALYFQVVQHFQPIDSAAAAVKAAPRKPSPPRKKAPTRLTFGGYPCPRDCAEDKAGYQWAARNHITDADDCSGSSGAFIEGCRVYAEQQAARPAAD